jgi:hypothetical protein
MANELQAFQDGVALADAGGDAEEAKARQQEEADVKKWFKTIEDARKFDEAQRKQYAADRCYARGDAGGYEVVVEIAQSNIEVLRAQLYAKDPDLNIQPAAATEPPPQRELEAQARGEAKQQQDQDAAQAAQLGQALGPVVGEAMQSGALANIIPAIAGLAQQGGAEQPAQDQPDPAADIAKAKGAPYQQLRQDAKQVAVTAEITVKHLWALAELKDKAKLLVGSALTIGIGWLKATWQERTGPNPDPQVATALNDAQATLARINATKAELQEGNLADAEAKTAELAQQIAALQSNMEILLSRGLAIDYVAAEDVQVSTDVAYVAQYKDASWVAHRSYVPKDEARAQFPELCKDDDHDYIKSAATYHAKKPKDPSETRDTGWVAATNLSAEDADQYSKGGEGVGNVLVWEIWSKTTGNVITIMDGVKCYARKPYVPDYSTSRFYPFFQLPIGLIDGERHPRSLIARSCTLFDEYCQARSSWKRARARAIGKVVFNKTNLEAADVTAVEAATEQEYVGVAPVHPDTPIGNLFSVVEYAKIDPAVFDTGPIRAEIEQIWGVQEALTASIQVAKTATEAEIQQAGTNSRGDYKKDGLDSMLTDLAKYTCEIAVQKLSREDVVEIAGSWALWPEGITAQNLPTLLNVDIKAGSTGKPNTAQRQQAWSVALPLVKETIVQIGQLRGSTPNEIADCLEEVVRETFERTGERVDVDRFLPDPPAEGTQPPKPPPPPPSESSMQGQQVTAMTAIVDQVRTLKMSAESAQAVLKACYPTVDPSLIADMVTGATKVPAITPADAAAMRPNPVAPEAQPVLQ